MKKSLTVILSLFSLTTHAADLLVAVGGSGSIHPNIMAAHAAAVDGDRILVSPGVYTENLVITKSLEIASNSQTLRYTVNGNLLFSPGGISARTCTILSMVLTGNVTDNGPLAPTGSVLRLIDSKMNNIITSANAIRYVLMSDSVMNGATLTKSDVIDCYLRSDAGSMPALSFFAQAAQTSTNLIVGNEIVAQATNIQTVLQGSPYLPMRVENNLFRLGQNSACWVGNASGASTSVQSTFVNNSVSRSATGVWYVLQLSETDAAYSFNVRNNFSVAPTSPAITTSGATIVQDYNLWTTNTSYINAATGAALPGSGALNAGDPDPSYTDLDLSRNDMGCYGGSFSRDNFDDPMPTTALVLLVDVPRRTQASTSISITIDGIDR